MAPSSSLAEKREVVLRQSFDDKTVAFDKLAQEIKAANVEVIVSTLNDFQAIAFDRGPQRKSLHAVLLGGDTVKTTDMGKRPHHRRHLRHVARAGGQEFVTGRQFLKNTSASRSPRPMAAITATRQHVRAVGGAGRPSRPSQDVTAAMHAINGYAPVTGTMTWDDKGRAALRCRGV